MLVKRLLNLRELIAQRLGFLGFRNAVLLVQFRFERLILGVGIMWIEADGFKRAAVILAAV